MSVWLAYLRLPKDFDRTPGFDEAKRKIMEDASQNLMLGVGRAILEYTGSLATPIEEDGVVVGLKQLPLNPKVIWQIRHDEIQKWSREVEKEIGELFS